MSHIAKDAFILSVLAVHVGTGGRGNAKLAGGDSLHRSICHKIELVTLR